jgi:hypothetical protein
MIDSPEELVPKAAVKPGAAGAVILFGLYVKVVTDDDIVPLVVYAVMV